MKKMRTSNLKKAIVMTFATAIQMLSIASVTPTPAEAATCEKAYFPGNVLQVTQGAYNEFNAYSHGKQNAFDLGGNSNYVMPFSGKVVATYAPYNVVTVQSTNKVLYADGTIDWMTVSFVHDNNISDLYVGKVLKAGTVFYQPGVKDPTGLTTGTHLHLAVRRGRVNTYFFSGDVRPSDALWLRKSTTIRQRGGYAWSVDGSTTALVNGGIYTIQPTGKNLYVSAAGTANLANVRLSNLINNYSKWKAVSTSKGWYFQNVATGKVLDINGQSVRSGSNVQLYQLNSCPTEYYTPKPNGSGCFIIQTTNKRVCVDCCGSSSTLKSGSNIWCYGINYDSTQLYRFNKVG